MHVGVHREQREPNQQEMQQRLAQPALEDGKKELFGLDCGNESCSSGTTVYRHFTHSRNNSYGFAGVYQMGDVQARCWTVAATFGFGGRFSLAAQYVDQRGVGISSTRA